MQTNEPFDAAWKIPGTPNLSKTGREAVISAIRRGVRTRDICKTFRISPSAVIYWRMRA